MFLKSIDLAAWTAMALGVIAVLILSTGPIADGDVWWQMAYGKYFLDNGTLIPDHSIFSWTEASNIHIYCAWIAEIALYLIYESMGLKGLFGLRYFVMLLPIILILWLGKKYKSPPSALVWFVFLICYLMSYASGGLIKPELFSFMFMSLLVANYFAIKSGGDDAWKLSYVFPALILLWSNTHGGFVIGLLFLATAAFGEMLNYYLGSQNALETKNIRHLTVAAVLSGIAMLCTPYGWKYPYQLMTNVQDFQDLSTIVAYQTIYSPDMKHLFHPFYLYLSGALIIPLLAEQIIRRRLDYSVLFINVLFVIFYIRFGRMTYFYAVVMLFSIQYLLASSTALKSVASRRPILFSGAMRISLVLMLTLIGHRVLDRINYPSRDNSFDFGISTMNPVTEAEFISKNFSTSKLCNSYAGGGYLLWRLWPQQKVMIDPRYFPFKSWYSEWVKLYSSEGASVLPKYDCSVWAVNFTYPNLNTSLRDSPEWKLVFIGASSAVYARKSTLEATWKTQLGEDLLSTKWTGALISALNILVNSDELRLANKVATSMEKRFRRAANQPWVDQTVAYVRGVIAYQKRDYVMANQLLIESQHKPAPIGNLSLLIHANQFLTYELWKQGRYVDARDVALEGVALAPENPGILFNAGTLLLANTVKERDPLLWQKYLNKFIALAENNSQSTPSNYVNLARAAVQAREVEISSFSPLRPISRPSELDPLSLYY